MSCSELDPMEDTESGLGHLKVEILLLVAANSIRWRILKEYNSSKCVVGRCCCSELDPMEDTESVNHSHRAGRQGGSCSELDPMEDTERS